MVTQESRRNARHPVGWLYPLTLLALFAILALLIVALATQAYQGIARRAEDNAQAREALNYIANKLRAEDCADAVSVEDIDGTRYLLIRKTIADAEYETRIFFYEGALCEQFAGAGLVYEPGFGDLLTRLADFSLVMDGRRIDLTAETESGARYSMSVCLRADGGVGQ